MRSLVVVYLLLSLSACTLGPSEQSDGFAEVAGQVFQSSGAPLADRSVVVSCAAGALLETTPTDSAGRYHVALTAPARVMTGANTRLACRVGAPDLVHPLAQVDTTFGFTTLAVPHAIQLLNLYEVPAPFR